MLYLDTSVLASYYCPEPDSETVEKVMMQSKGYVISHLTEVELVSAISRKVRENTLSSTDGNRIVAQFESHIKERFFQILPVEFEHYKMAKSWIAQFNTSLRTLDALHLALAASHRLILFTSDQQLKESARNVGIDVLTT